MVCCMRISCVFVKGLTPGQEYVYHVESNDQQSQNYSFTAMRTDKVRVIMEFNVELLKST